MKYSCNVCGAICTTTHRGLADDSDGCCTYGDAKWRLISEEKINEDSQVVPEVQTNLGDVSREGHSDQESGDANLPEMQEEKSFQTSVTDIDRLIGTFNIDMGYCFGIVDITVLKAYWLKWNHMLDDDSMWRACEVYRAGNLDVYCTPNF